MGSSAARLVALWDMHSMNRLIAVLMSVMVTSALANDQSQTGLSPIPEYVAKRIEACGVGPATVRFDDLQQDEVLTIENSEAASDAQLQCVDEVTGKFHVALPPGVQKRFDEIRASRWSVFMLAEARKWVEQNGLTDRVPPYNRGVSDDAAFAHQLEELCGPAARGALQSSDGPHAVSREWIAGLDRLSTRKRAKTFLCLLTVARVAGFELGFTGNEVVEGGK